MYLIRVKFISDIEQVYTQEEETATDFEYAIKKFDRMIDRWFLNIFTNQNIISYTTRDEKIKKFKDSNIKIKFEIFEKLIET